MSTIQRKKRRPNGGAGKGLQSQKIIKSAESFVKSLATFDLNITKTCSLCANQRSPLANLRPLMKLLEISCHGVPWLLGTVLLLVSLHKENHIEILVNLFIGKKNKKNQYFLQNKKSHRLSGFSLFKPTTEFNV